MTGRFLFTAAIPVVLIFTSLSCSDEDKIAAAITDQGDELEQGTPVPFLLGQNDPNPFNGATVIGFTLYDTMHVVIHVYTEDWQEVATLVDQDYTPTIRSQGPPGANYEVLWAPGDNTASGDYYCTMHAKGITEIIRMKLMK